MTPSPSPSLQQLEILAGGGLLFVWDDGHETTLEAAPLRAACPCAGCRGGAVQVRDGIRVVRASRVGRYALQIVWSDGHGTGIYPFRLLREMCACVHCRYGVASREENRC